MRFIPSEIFTMRFKIGLQPLSIRIRFIPHISVAYLIQQYSVAVLIEQIPVFGTAFGECREHTRAHCIIHHTFCRCLITRHCFRRIRHIAVRHKRGNLSHRICFTAEHKRLGSHIVQCLARHIIPAAAISQHRPHLLLRLAVMSHTPFITEQ